MFSPCLQHFRNIISRLQDSSTTLPSLLSVFNHCQSFQRILNEISNRTAQQRQNDAKLSLAEAACRRLKGPRRGPQRASFFCSSAQSPTFPGASHGQTEPWTVCDFPRNVLFSHPNNTDRNQQTNVLGNCEVASALNIDSLDAVNQGDGSFSRSRICCRASFARCFSSS